MLSTDKNMNEEDFTEVNINQLNGCGLKNGAYYSFRVE